MNQNEAMKILKSLASEVAFRNESEYSPIIKASLSTLGPVHVDLMLQNVGKTAAIDVSLEFWLEPGEYRKTYHTPLLMPKEQVKFFLPESDMKILAEKFDNLKVRGECKNIFGKIFRIESVIDIKKVLESWIDGGVALQYTLDDRLRDLTNKVERLERTLDRMKAWSGGVLVKTPIDLKNEEKEWEKRRKEIRAKKEAEKKSPENE